MRINRTSAAMWVTTLLLLADSNAAAPVPEDGRIAKVTTEATPGVISASSPTSDESDRHRWWPSGFLLTGERVVHVEIGQAEEAAPGLPRGWFPATDSAIAQARGTFSAPILRNAEGHTAWGGDRIFVHWKVDATPEQRQEALDGLAVDATCHDYRFIPNLSLIRLDVDSAEAVLEHGRRLADSEAVFHVEPDLMISGHSGCRPGGDPLFASSWHLENMGQAGGTAGFDLGAESAWEITLGSQAGAVLVFDTGVDEFHPDLNILEGRDFTGGDPAGSPGGGPLNGCEAHGTPVAGCISSIRGNGLGTAGLAPASPSISARVFEANVAACDGSWWAFWSWTINALDWGRSRGIRITNNSNFYSASPTSIVAAYNATAAAGQVHFASAGNSGILGMEFPASIDSVQAIGATDRFGNLASFSNFGSQLAMVAPGLEIWSTDVSGSDGYTNGDYALMWGTSFASPLAAGVASLVLSVAPGLTADEVIGILIGSCLDMEAPGFDSATGWGMIQADEAVRLARKLACPSDLNGDGVVGGPDLGLLFASWGDCSDDCLADLNDDRIVNGEDLGMLFTTWGDCG